MIQSLNDDAGLSVAVQKIAISCCSCSNVEVETDVLQSRQRQRVIWIQRQVSPQSETMGDNMNAFCEILRDCVPDNIAIEHRSCPQINEEPRLAIPGNQVPAHALRQPVTSARRVIQPHPAATTSIDTTAHRPIEAKRIRIDDRHLKRSVRGFISQNSRHPNLFTCLQTMSGRCDQDRRAVAGSGDDISGPGTKSSRCVISSVADRCVQAETVRINHGDFFHTIGSCIAVDVTDSNSLT